MLLIIISICIIINEKSVISDNEYSYASVAFVIRSLDVQNLSFIKFKTVVTQKAYNIIQKVIYYTVSV